MQQSYVKFYLLCLFFLVSTKGILKEIVEIGKKVGQDFKVILEQNGTDHSNSIEQYNGTAQQDSGTQVEKVIVKRILPIVRHVVNQAPNVIKLIKAAYRKLDIADDNIISEHTNNSVPAIEKPAIKKSRVIITFLGSVLIVVIFFTAVVIWRRQIIYFRWEPREEQLGGRATSVSTTEDPVTSTISSPPNVSYTESYWMQYILNTVYKQWADIKLPPGVREIPITDLKVVRGLGKGGFALVLEVEFVDNVKEKYNDICDQKIAIKIVNNGFVLNGNQIEAILKEIDVMKDLDSQYVVKLIGASLHVCPSIVMELVPHGPLKKLIYSDGFKSTQTSLQWKLKLILSISKGIQYLHSKQIVHKDLKPQNILIQDRDQAEVKISDFGLSKITNATGSTSQKGRQGTEPYMAPEVCQERQKITNKVDIWALGVIMQEIIRGVEPWKGQNHEHIFQQLALYEQPPDGGQLPETRQDLCALIRSCWCKAEERPSADKVVSELKVILQRLATNTNSTNQYTLIRFLGLL